MKAWKVVFGLGVGYGVYEGFNLYQTAKNLIFGFSFPRSIKLNFQAWVITFVLPVTIVNTRKDSVKINGLNFTVKTAGVSVGQAYVKNAFVIPANSETTQNVECVVSVENLISAIIDIIPTVSKPIIFTFDGSITASNIFTVPIVTEVRMTLLSEIIALIKANSPKPSPKITRLSARSYFSQVETDINFI